MGLPKPALSLGGSSDGVAAQRPGILYVFWKVNRCVEPVLVGIYVLECVQGRTVALLLAGRMQSVFTDWWV
jgi:hypothetical protein